eukprot:scaffold463350_cov44-Prasinocladus_malaysianus.AAC.1
MESVAYIEHQTAQWLRAYPPDATVVVQMHSSASPPPLPYLWSSAQTFAAHWAAFTAVQATPSTPSMLSNTIRIVSCVSASTSPSKLKAIVVSRDRKPDAIRAKFWDFSEGPMWP